MPRTESTEQTKYLIDTPVNPKYFVFLNKLSKDEDFVFVARAVGEGKEMRVEYFPQKTHEVQMMMWTNWQFDERATNYVSAKFSHNKPDRSQYTELRELECGEE
jgi:hypothetical protein